MVPRMMYETFRQMHKMLGQLDVWLVKATEHAQKKNFDPNVFLSCRLIADQFPLSRQIQAACDASKLAAARLSGQEAPKHPDTEQTIDELRARIASVRKYLDGFSAKDFDASRLVTQPRWEGKSMKGGDYFLEHALSNFFFHVTHTYAILRHNGVELGKRDYLGPLTFQ